ncbi:hypothetical protein M1271_07385 [Patescibacteria group bacterium]|nr:hypothetical protein [Patescibacteria group bacterium]MCL5797423.1 hypothetical protein [Patescibacteria group bacterium]
MLDARELPYIPRIDSAKPKDVFSQYTSILGLREFPRSPSEVPHHVRLPREVIGDLGYVVKLTSEDPKHRERDQNVFFQKGNFVKSDISIGSESGTSKTGELKRRLRAAIGERAFLSFHTHPQGRDTLSEGDLAVALGNSNTDLIEAMASPKRVVALFRTKYEIDTPTIPLVTENLILRYLNKAYGKLVKRFLGKASYQDIRTRLNLERLKYLEERGVAVLYADITPDQILTNFKDGLVLTKVTQDMIRNLKLDLL